MSNTKTEYLPPPPKGGVHRSSIPDKGTDFSLRRYFHIGSDTNEGPVSSYRDLRDCMSVDTKSLVVFHILCQTRLFFTYILSALSVPH